MQLKMFRPADAEIPIIPVPDGFTIREMRPGEEPCWCFCCQGEFGVEDEAVETFNRKMLEPSYVRENVFFTCRDDKPVGTATARSCDGEAYLHYIAVNPCARGHKLAKALISTVLQRHAEQGRFGCFLTTDDFRVPAVYTYLTIGYIPVLWTDDARERWEKMLALYGMKSCPAYDSLMRPAPDIVVPE